MGTAQEIVVSAEANGVATVTLDRPGKRNAVSLAMWRRLAETFSELGSRNDVHVVILTGAGGNFCAGADISEFSTVRADSRSGRIYEAANESKCFFPMVGYDHNHTPGSDFYDALHDFLRKAAPAGS